MPDDRLSVTDSDHTPARDHPAYGRDVRKLPPLGPKADQMVTGREMNNDTGKNDLGFDNTPKARSIPNNTETYMKVKNPRNGKSGYLTSDDMIQR